MVFSRGVDPDEHVYANPVSSFLQQVGKASGKFLSKLVKEVKYRVRARQARKKHRPPSHVQLSSQPKGRRSPRPEPGNYDSHRLQDTLSRHRKKGSTPAKLYHSQQRSRTYESTSQTNPQTMLHSTSPGLPMSHPTTEGQSSRSSISITETTRQIPQATATKSSLRRSRPNWPLKDIPEVLMPGSITVRTERLDLPLSADDVHARGVQHADELWFTSMPAEIPDSPLFSLTPCSSQDQDSASSVSLPLTQHVNPQASGRNFTSPDSHQGVVAPVPSLKPSRSSGISCPPRIPTLYFRPGSPFAGGNFPWGQTQLSSGDLEISESLAPGTVNTVFGR